MYSFVLFCAQILITFSDASNEAHFECGPHGRFEYCIDGIPGCVVGCHCHPGYYFDTETKICEPNIKLAQDYRRHYYLEPTRMPYANTLTTVSPPTPSTPNPVDEKVDAIAQDADDLGDWLYNQFFKTIENQVINKTDGETLTRRSGSSAMSPAQPMLQRRSRKRQKKSSKRKKSGKKRFHKKGLKKKLLRITEDDSLFDSTSDESDTSDDSSSDISSSESMSDSSFETDKDRSHGHRKILMINKKPTPPLPSFIFLPNVETPFYPPIGLPPPPIIPMYPMVPVPPVGSFMVTPANCDTKSPTSATNSGTTQAATTTDPNSTTGAATTETTTDASQTTTSNGTLRSWDKASAQNNNHRNKMMRLRNRMKKKNRKPPTQPLDFPDEDAPFLNDGESPLPMKFRSQPLYDNIPPLDDVDFKYLSQLIHKVDLNKTKPNSPMHKNRGIEVPPNLDPTLLSRRNYIQTHQDYSQPDFQNHKPSRPASKADDMSESFYSNLGKQIAALIRKKVDNDGTTQFDIDVQKEGMQSPMHAIFNENPRSYWERFVRSPLEPPRTYRGFVSNIKHSSENLLYLEDQVSVATAIERIFNLQELENIANTMVRSRSQVSKKKPAILKLTRNPSPVFSKTFGVSLLPQEMRRSNSVSHTNNKHPTYINNNHPKITNNHPEYRNNNNPKNTNKHPEYRNNNNPKNTNNKQPEYINKNMLPSKYEEKPPPANFYIQPRKNAIYRNLNMTNQKPVIVANNVTNAFLSKLFQSPRKSPLHNQVSRIVQRNITAPIADTQRFVKYQLNPMVVNYKSINYIGNNRKQYHSQQAIIPYPLYSQHTAIRPTTHRSYFRHEYHHFDYFD